MIAIKCIEEHGIADQNEPNTGHMSFVGLVYWESQIESNISDIKLDDLNKNESVASHPRFLFVRTLNEQPAEQSDETDCFDAPRMRV